MNDFNWSKWLCFSLMIIVSVGIFYVLMSINTHPNPNQGWYFLTIGNLMYITVLMLMILGVVIYLYYYRYCCDTSHHSTCKMAALFYIFMFIGVVAISWCFFNYRLCTKSVFGLGLIIVGLIIFGLS